jgi:hypothetical protein
MDGLIVTSSDGRIAGFAVEELLLMRPIRERVNEPEDPSPSTTIVRESRLSTAAPYSMQVSDTTLARNLLPIWRIVKGAVPPSSERARFPLPARPVVFTTDPGRRAMNSYLRKSSPPIGLAMLAFLPACAQFDSASHTYQQPRTIRSSLIVSGPCLGGFDGFIRSRTSASYKAMFGQKERTL